MSAAIDSESIKFLDDVKKGKPRRFVMICRGASIQRLAVFKKGSAESILQRLKKEGFKGQSYIGVVDGKGQDISFKLCSSDGYDAEPGKPAFLKAFLSSEAGIGCKPKYEIVPELPNVTEDEEDAATASTDTGTAPPVTRAADPNAELRQKVREGIQKLTPAVKAFVAENPDRRQEVLQPLQLLKDFSLGDPTIDKTAVAKALGGIQKLVASTTPPSAAPTAEPAGQRGRKVWDEAVKAVLQQVESLRQTIAEHDEPSYQPLAKSIVATVSKRFDQRLTEACQKFDVDQNAEAVASVIREYTNFVKADEMMQMLDDNPFDVKLSVRPTLAKALAEVEKCVKSAARA